MFIVIFTYTRPLAIIDKLRPVHQKFLDKYYSKQIFVASGRQNPPDGTVILACNVTREELEEIVQKNPFYIKKVATYQIIEFKPTKANPLISYLIKHK